MNSFFSIIVTYNPDLDFLNSTIDSLLSQNITPVIVDNSVKQLVLEDIENMLFKKANLISVGCNKGIAYAQNLGIRHSMDSSADIVCFFDQDSTIPVNYSSHLLSQFDISKSEVRCPLSYDARTNEKLLPYVLNYFNFPRKIQLFNYETYLVHTTISSGTAVTNSVFEKVGFMNEIFFIDLVDNEWCLKCLHFSIPIYLHTKVVMHHSLGEGRSDFRHGGIKHSYFRTYYKTRNSVYLLKLRHVPINYSLFMILSSFIHWTSNLLICSEKSKYFKAGVLGYIHGVLKYPGSKLK